MTGNALGGPGGIGGNGGDAYTWVWSTRVSGTV
jgi:hypothetical protein